MHAPSGDPRLDPVYEFGLFSLNTRRRLLFSGADVVPLTAKVFDTLVFLIEQRARIVSKEELLGRIWREAVVEEGNLARNISTLRRILGDRREAHRYIVTVSGQGYRFVATVREVTEIESASPAGGAPGIDPGPTRLPAAAQWDAPGSLLRSAGNDVDGSYTPELDAWRAGLETAPSNSAATAEHVSRRRGLRFRMPAAILTAGGALVVSVALWIGWSADRPSADGHRIRSIAVLPLENLSADPDQEYFADGMTEALIGRLSSVRALRVISRTSVMQFKDTHRAVPEIAKALSVDAIIVGSVLRSGGRVRITAQLIDSRSGERNVWSDTFERELRDVLTLQSEVAQSIARSIQLTVTGEGKQRLTTARTVAPEVYEHYLKGRFDLTKPNRAAVQDSVTHFEAALALDPTFAPAYTGLSRAYGALGTIFHGALPPSETLPKSVAAAQQALRLDPDLAEAHALIAGARKRAWQWQEAEDGFRRALQLDPNSAVTHLQLAHLLSARGRVEEAIQLARRGRALDPLSPGVAASSCWTLYFARRYDEAIRECRSSLELQGDSHFALWYLGIALVETAQFDEAIDVLERAAAISSRSPGLLGSLVNVYARAGRRAEALRTLDELTRRLETAYVPPAAFVHAYAGLGERDQAFTWLERAYEERSNVIWQLNVAPTLDPIRDDGRFADLLRRVGLE